MTIAPPGAAEVWGYVDDTGQAHVASKQLDLRYRLFFKGDVNREASTAAAASTESPTLSTLPSAAPAMSTMSDVVSPRLQRLVNDPGSQRYARLIEQHAAQVAVDPALVKAIVAVESGFAPDAVSPQGALGLMQVMPKTAARYGISGDRKRSAEQKLLDPALNLQVGTRYLRDLLARFADDLALTLAAYNAGEYAVERYKNRVPPYPETVEYVKRVQKLYAAFRPASAATATIASAASVPVRQKGIRGTFLAQPKIAQSATEPVL